MSPNTMNYIYFITIGFVGLIMFLKPRSVMGKAKFDDSAVKEESIVKKCGIAIIITMVLISLYFLFFK